jgi:hypothetical protein
VASRDIQIFEKINKGSWQEKKYIFVGEGKHGLQVRVKGKPGFGRGGLVR